MFKVNKIEKALFVIFMLALAFPRINPVTPSEQWSAWKYSKTILLTENQNLERIDDLIIFAAEFNFGECLNATKEVRIVNKFGEEVISQVLEEVYSNGWCIKAKIAFLADQSPNSEEEYTLLFGNPQAEKPEYRGILVTKKGGVWQISVKNSYIEINPDGKTDLFLYGTPIGTLDLSFVYDNQWVGMHHEIKANKLIREPEPVVCGPLICTFKFYFSSSNIANIANLFIYYSSEDLRVFVKQNVSVTNPFHLSPSGRGVDFLRVADLTVPFKKAYEKCCRKTTYGLYQTAENITAYITPISEISNPPSYLFKAVENGPDVPADWVVMWGNRGFAVGMISSYLYSTLRGVDWWFRGGFHSRGGRLILGINTGQANFRPMNLERNERWLCGFWIYAYSGFDEKGIDTFAKKVRSPLLKTDATFHVYDRQNGMDINGAEVEVYDALAVLKGSGKTGIDGTWTISSLKSNFYLILVMAEGYRSYYEIKGLYGDTVEIPLARISQPALTLRIYWPNGSVVPDAEAEISVGGKVFKGYGNWLGVYEFSGLPEGTAQVKVKYLYEIPDLRIHISRTNQTSVDLKGHSKIIMVLSETRKSNTLEIAVGVIVVAAVVCLVVYRRYFSKRVER